MTILDQSDSVEDQVGDVESQRPKTILPQISPIALPPSDTRKIAGISREDLGNILGAGASSIAVTYLLFGLLAPLQGSVGFVVVAFLIFLGLYALLVSLTNPSPIVVDKVMTAILAASGALALAALASVVAFTLWR